ncbi:hypothetical protein I7I48_08608 [Histoplasma ohiense]|nr:hypothetical protein I7I48_08608 [Histoplasma ohiense (nom. inval.)]
MPKRNVPPTSPLPQPPADHSCLGTTRGSQGAEEWSESSCKAHMCGKILRGSFADCLPDCWLRLFTLAGQRLFSRSASIVDGLQRRYYHVLLAVECCLPPTVPIIGCV